MTKSTFLKLNFKDKTLQTTALVLIAVFAVSLMAGCGGGGEGGTNPPPPPTRMAERVAFVGPDMTNPNAANDFVNLGLDDRQEQENIVLANFPSGSLVVDMQFSPDGEYIAFLAGPNLVDTALYVLSFDTGIARQVNPDDSLRFVSSFDWSPDSLQLAYAHKSTISDAEFVALVNRDGTNDRRISTENTGSFSAGSPKFSPDGRYVLQEVSRVNGSNTASVPNALSFVDLTASSLTSTTLTSARQSVKEVEWSSNSRTICYVMNNEQVGDPEIFRVRVSNVATTSPNSSIVSSNSNFFGDCAWSANGRNLAYTFFENGVATTLASREVDPANTSISGPQTIVSFSNSGISEFAWAPGSDDVLAFIRRRGITGTATTDELYQDSISGGLLQLNVDLVATNRDVFEFEWSPDASKVAYLADNETDGVQDLYVTNADGSNKIRISDFASGEEVRNFHWSADSTRIAFTAGPPGRTVAADKVYAATADGISFVQLNTLVVGPIIDIEYTD